MRTTGLLLAVAFALIWTTSASPVATAQDAAEVPEGANWRADLNRGVTERNHWRWTLRRVERVGDELTVALRYKNNASAGRPILLEDQYMTTIALVDEVQAETRYPLLGVEGISEEVTPVDRKKSKSAVFTFTYPEGATRVWFKSRWISMRMGGEASVMEVDFPIDLPPASAKPS